MKRFLFLFGFFISGEVLACQFNYDCNYGSKCVKEFGQRYGVCMGGNLPGNQNDQRPVYNPYNASDRVGDQCVWDSQCGPRGNCVKSVGRNWGVCY